MQLFLAGYLHQDVTIGNVLARYDPQEWTEVMREGGNHSMPTVGSSAFLGPYLNECSGFIIDGDLAIRWTEARTPAKHRSVIIVS